MPLPMAPRHSLHPPVIRHPLRRVPVLYQADHGCGAPHLTLDCTRVPAGPQRSLASRPTLAVEMGFWLRGPEIQFQSRKLDLPGESPRHLGPGGPWRTAPGSWRTALGPTCGLVRWAQSPGALTHDPGTALRAVAMGMCALRRAAEARPLPLHTGTSPCALRWSSACCFPLRCWPRQRPSSLRARMGNGAMGQVLAGVGLLVLFGRRGLLGAGPAAGVSGVLHCGAVVAHCAGLWRTGWGPKTPATPRRGI